MAKRYRRDMDAGIGMIEKMLERLSSNQALLAALLVGSLSMLAGCAESPCADTECEFGTCDSETGECRNKDSCRVDEDCLVGYICGSEGACEPQESCSEQGDCSVGTCQQGVCVNPDRCDSNDECLPRTYCSNLGNCVVDPCHEVQCKRGVCEPGTDNCVSADSCTERTELFDCVAGEQCANGECTPRGEFCERLECDRGVCSFERGGCVNAMDCQGDTQRCAQGYYCNDMDRCERNRCEELDVDCGNRGTCQPATGQCQNAEECQDDADCVRDHRCVRENSSDQTGTCRLTDMLCGQGSGDGGCPGNKRCEYDADTGVGQCIPPEVCETSIDCNGTDHCGGRSCIQSFSCRQDIYEPNDAYADATLLTQVSESASVSGSLCAGDTDTYIVIPNDLVDPTTEGTMVVDVTLPKRDVGLGGADMVLRDSDRQEIASASLGPLGQGRTMRVTTPLSLTDRGEYIIEVTPAEDLKSPPGVSYDLDVDIVPEATVRACSNARSVTVGERISADISQSMSRALRSSCLSDQGTGSQESVVELNIPESQEVTIRATPLTDAADLSLSLRSRCLAYASERECTNQNGPGGSETISRILGAGTYYLVVQAPAGSSPGAYQVSVDGGYRTECAEGDSFCSNPTVSNICGSDGSDYQEFSCISQCNPSTGRCFPPRGDRCVDAPTVQKGAGGYNVDFPLGQLTDQSTLPPQGCIASTQPRTGGPDRTFDVQIPPNNAITAEVTFGGDVQGSMYLAETCSDLSGTCVKGVQDSGSASNTEVLRYANDSPDFQTRKLVVDTASGQDLDNAEVSITYAEITCEPGTSRCGAEGNVETCNEIGTEYEVTSQCFAWECSNGSCQRPDTCMDALDVTPSASRAGGVRYRDAWGELADDFGGSGCNISSQQVSGNDSVYEVNLAAGEVLDASLQSSFPVNNDPALYVMPTCGELSSSCLDGDVGGNSPAEIQYYASEQETVYLVADADDTEDETFTLDLIIRQSVCTPGSTTCVTGDVQYCEPSGLAQRTYSCGGGGGCSSGRCDTSSSDFCFDAEDVTSALKSNSGLDKSLDWSNYSRDISPRYGCGNVRTFDTDGQDAFFMADLAAGETLDASLNPNGSATDATLTLVSDCLRPAFSCLAGDAPFTGSADVSYTATTAETVFLIADHDDGSSTPSTNFSLTGTIR